MAPLFYTRKQAESLASVAAEQAKKKQAIIDTINVENLDRAKADVQKWRNALEYWEDIRTPDRYEMMQLYQEIIQDDSVATHINTIIRRIEGTEIELGRPTTGGFNPDLEAVNMLRGDWFNQVIRYVIEAELMGFTLVEMLKPATGKYSPDTVQLIPREYVIPEWGKVRTRPSVFTELLEIKKYASRLLQIGDRKEKGLFNNMALLYIYKKNAMAFWANYQSKFGIPPVIVKTDLANKQAVDSLVSFMQNMRNNTFGLIGRDDEASIMQGVNADVFETFLKLIEHADKQIAKVLEGQTMTSNDGSSRSQAEVHEDTAEHFHMARLRRVERVVNEQLLPIMAQDGYKVEGLMFRFKEVKDLDQIIDRVVKLKQAGFTVDAEYLSDLTGLPLEKMEPPAVMQPQSIMKAIDELYNSAEECHC
jgi:hypothetical protein